MATLTEQLKNLEVTIAAINSKLEESSGSYESMKDQAAAVVELALKQKDAITATTEAIIEMTQQAEKSATAITNASRAIEKGAAGFAGESGATGNSFGQSFSTSNGGNAVDLIANALKQANSGRVGGLEDAIKQLTDKINSEENAKRISEEGVARAQRILDEAKAFANGRQDVGATLPISNATRLVERMQAQAYAQQQEIDKAKTELNQLVQQQKTTGETTQASAEWKAAITDLQDFVKSLSENKFTNNSEQSTLNQLLQQMTTTYNNNKPQQVYQINLGDSKIRTIDDPSDLITLIEQLSKSKRVAL